jgi:hypothetical protein
MQVAIDVIDNLTAQALPGATIAVNGTAVGMTDNNGVYILDNVNESDQIQVSFVGYQTANVNAGILESSAQVQLSSSVQTLESVTVTPSKKESSLLPLLIAGGVAVAGSKNKSVGAIKKNTALIVGAGALGLGAVYLLSRPKTTTPIAPLPTSTYRPPTSGGSALQQVTSLIPSGGFLDSIKNLFSAVSQSSNPYDTAPVNYYQGYQPTVTAPDVVNPGGYMNLDFSGAPGMSGIDFTSPITIGVLAVGTYLLLKKSSKKKVGKVEYEKYILPVGIIVGGYLVFSKLGLFSPTAGDQNANAVTDTTTAGVAASIQAAKNAGQSQTVSDSQAATLANEIYNAGISDPVDMDTIQTAVIQANTQLDLLKIIQAFGTKKGGGTACSIFGNLLSSVCNTYDLGSWLRATLDASHIFSVNNYLSAQGINYQF